LLALLETRFLKPEQVQTLTRDPDATNARLAHLFLENSGVIEPAATAALPGSAHAPMGPIAPALRAPIKPTTIADALPLIGAADPKRGEQIFMGEGGPGCWMCHRISQRGRAFGPDLTTVGDRNDPRYLVESILAPNAIVTEGYATLQVSTRNECDLTGLLVEETDSLLTLAQAAGPPLRIRKDRLTNRQSLHTSPMPSHAEALAPQDVADVVAFLLAQRSGPQASSPTALPVSARPGATVAFAARDNALAITIAGKPFATYVFKDPKVLRPYLAHVRARSGVQATRNFPPVAGQDATDHDAIHPGIWFAVGDLNGADFWRNKATVEHIRFLREPREGSDAGEFTVLNRYVHRGAPLAEETARWRFLVREQGVLILYESEFRPAGEEFYFGDQEEIGFAIRLATPLAVNNGGWMRDSLGRRNEKGIWGKTADWVAYGGRIGDETVGVLLMPSPSNFRPCWFHARDYGFVAANPFGRKAFTGGEPSRVVVKRGETLRLSYGMLVFSRATGSEPDFAAAYRDFLGVSASPPSANEK
jgi:putative heme-binding domain-containing protein